MHKNGFSSSFFQHNFLISHRITKLCLYIDRELHSASNGIYIGRILCIAISEGARYCSALQNPLQKPGFRFFSIMAQADAKYKISLKSDNSPRFVHLALDFLAKRVL